MTVIPIIIRALGTVNKGLIQVQEDLEIKKTSRDHPNYGMIVIDQNTAKSPGNLRTLAVTQTSVKNTHNNNNLRLDMTGW